MMSNRVAGRVLAMAGAVLCCVGGAFAQDVQPKMGEPLNGLTQAQLDRFVAGKAAFELSLDVPDGLGPIFNQSSCASCHDNPIGGSGSQFVRRFGAAGKKGFDPLNHLGGSLLQQQTIDVNCAEVIPPEATITSKRITPSILGFGLVEAIPDADLLVLANSPPPGVSGRAHMVAAAEDPMGSPLRVGRFGWKSQVPTVLTFSGDAAVNEMGLTNRLFSSENAPNGNMGALAACDMVADPEDGPDGQGFHFIDRVTDFQRFLAPPPQTPRSGMTGETIFNNLGCADCHAPSFTTSNDPMLEDAIRNQTLRPYSDFLIHGMGQNADFIGDGQATETEMRTMPLWGIRVRDPLWHDGRFAGGTIESRLTDAILAHNSIASEGQASGQAFAALSQADKDAVIAFLLSLGRAEFDGDGDNDVDDSDFLDFRSCYGSSGVLPDDACAVHDFDQDGDITLADFDKFLIAYDGVLEDCDNSGTPDLREILTGALADTNMDLVPDICECPGDGNGDNTIDVIDLNLVIGNFGTVGPAGDLNGDGSVNIGDLNLVVGNFGVSCGP